MTCIRAPPESMTGMNAPYARSGAQGIRVPTGRLFKAVGGLL